MLALHRALLALRRARPALALGELDLLPAQGDVLAYARRLDEARVVVVLNLGGEAARWSGDVSGLAVLASTLPGPPAPQGPAGVALRPNEGLVLG